MCVAQTGLLAGPLPGLSAPGARCGDDQRQLVNCPGTQPPVWLFPLLPQQMAQELPTTWQPRG